MVNKKKAAMRIIMAMDAPTAGPIEDRIDLTLATFHGDPESVSVLAEVLVESGYATTTAELLARQAGLPDGHTVAMRQMVARGLL